MSLSDTAKVKVVNRALIKLGLPASFSIDAETELGGTVDLVWQGVEARSVAIFDWSFCRRTDLLSVLADPPTNGWQYGFQLPSDRIGEPLAILDQVAPAEHFLRDYMLEAGKVYANIATVWARCRVMLDPQFWDRGFAEAYATALAAELAVPLTQDQGAAEVLSEAAWGPPREQGTGGLFGKLLGLNRAATPQGRRFMDDDPLTNARFR